MFFFSWLIQVVSKGRLHITGKPKNLTYHKYLYIGILIFENASELHFDISEHYWTKSKLFTLNSDLFYAVAQLNLNQILTNAFVNIAPEKKSLGMPQMLHKEPAILLKPFKICNITLEKCSIYRFLVVLSKERFSLPAQHYLKVYLNWKHHPPL